MDALIETSTGLFPSYAATIIAFLLGIGLAAILFQIISRVKAKTFQQDLQREIDGAKKEAENIIKSAKLDAAAEAIKKKEEMTAEANRVRGELRETEQRLSKREDVLEKQIELVEQRENSAKNLEKESQHILPLIMLYIQ